MSYLKIKVNNKVPNQNGNLTVNLSDIISVDSPVDGQFLQKSETNWQTNKLTSSAQGLLNYYGTTLSGNTSYRYDLEDNFITHKNSYNIASGLDLTSATASSYIPVSTSTWAMGYRVSLSNFPTGSVILFRAVVGTYRLSGSTLTLQWYKGSPYSNISSSIPIGNKAFSTQAFGATAFGLYEVTGESDWASLRVVDKTGGIGITAGAVASVQQITAKQLM